MSESIEKATSGGDFLVWTVTFSLLIVVAAGLAYWDIKSPKE